LRFSNSFEVPLPPNQAWATLMDIPSIAPCMPGAELTEKVDDRTYKGKVSVRLGPIALAFAGVATFEEIDEQAHKASVKAQGADAKGRGGANALVRFSIEPTGGGSKVLIDTDLNLSGSVAQYGRGAGLIQGVATQLTTQFAKALAAQIAASEPPPAAVASSGTTAAGKPAATTSTEDSAPVPAPRQARPAVEPIGGFSLVLKAVWASLRGLFQRST
jgi:carbon monoxide dehydrogenase subunit G